MSLLVISGISGAGKTLTSNTLEDIGYNVIDNLPPSLLLSVSKLNDVRDLAVVVDSRSKNNYESLLTELQNLKEAGVDYKLLFLYCDSEVTLKRYKYTRRPHPLLSPQYPSIQQAIDYEYEICKEIMDKADIVIDTTYLSPAQLRNNITDTFKNDDYNGLTVKLVSFGFKNGIPQDADLVYDVRCMPNPFYIEQLKPLSGMDNEVIDYVFSFPQSNDVLNMMKQFVEYTLPYYVNEGKNELVIAIGCTSGHHRSVAFVGKLQQALAKLEYKTVVIHRDISKNF